MNDDLLFKQDGGRQVVDTDFLDIYIKMLEGEKQKEKDKYKLSDIIEEAKNYPKDESNMKVSDIIAEVKNAEKSSDTNNLDLDSILEEFQSSKEEKKDDFNQQFVLWEPKESDDIEMLDVPEIAEKKQVEAPKITNLEPEIDQRIANENAIYQELMSIFQKEDSKPQETDKQQNIKDFKNRLKKLWNQCIIKTPRPWDNPAAVVGTGLINIFYYDKNKIIEHSEEIIELLSLVKSTTSFDELGILNDGQEWAQTIQPREILMSLGDALNTVKFRTLDENAAIVFNHNR